MRRNIIFLIAICFFKLSHASDAVFRLILLNPGIEYEHLISNKSAMSYNIGYGYGVSYPGLTGSTEGGFLYMFSPFFDVKYKFIYNQRKREEKGKSLLYNSGNFVGVRLLVRGKETASNFYRFDNVDYSIGPVWGIQRSFKRSYLHFNIGPTFYFDTMGNNGILPIMFEFNYGLNLSKRK